VYVDKRVLLRHSGAYVFCMENQQHLLNTIGPMYIQEQQAQAAQQAQASAAPVDAGTVKTTKKSKKTA